MTELSLEERATNADTREHIECVRNLINYAVAELLRRGEVHDQSKLGDVERKTFTEYTPKLRTSTYGSPEYHGFLREMKPALDNHYANNRHHPEHHKDGIDSMNLIDLLEMILDWKAATLRHADGDLMRSLEINKDRFSISPQLFSVLENTVRDLGLVRYGQPPEYDRGHADCMQDAFENAHFASIGGPSCRVDMKAPEYIKPAETDGYLRGYRSAARAWYGPGWRQMKWGV